MTEFRTGATVRLDLADVEWSWDEPADKHHYTFVSWVDGQGVVLRYRDNAEMFFPTHRIASMAVISQSTPEVY